MTHDPGNKNADDQADDLWSDLFGEDAPEPEDDVDTDSDED